MRILKNLSILFSIILGNVGHSQEADFGALQSLGETSYHKLYDEELDQDYHIFIRSPEIAVAGKQYPVVYLLDGGITFPLLGAYYRYLFLEEELPELVIVGISYGTNDWKKGNNRSRDYTAPAASRSFWGGADKFKTFLNTKLFPFIEMNYAVDKSQRIIFGQSIGGQFVLYAAQTSPDMFKGYIASNPALHRNLDFFLQSKSDQVTQSKLFVSSAGDDDSRFRGPALKWMEHWNSEEQRPWDLNTVTLDSVGHFSAAPQAFRQGMKWILGK